MNAEFSGLVVRGGDHAASLRCAANNDWLADQRRIVLLERSSPGHEVISLSWLVSNRLLYLFALADTRGQYQLDEPARGEPRATPPAWRA